MSMAPGTDLEAGKGTGKEAPAPTLDTLDEHGRRKFISKVYVILTVQISSVAVILAMCILNEDLQHFANKNSAFQLGATVIFFVSFFILVCFISVARSPPWNWILLTIFTLSFDCIAAIIASNYPLNEILLAAGLTVVVCFSLTLFAWQTAVDFTVFYGIMCVLVLILPFFFLIWSFFADTFAHTVYVFIYIIIFSIYLIMDTQAIMGGRAVQFQEDDYVLAALRLYLDVMYLFLYILEGVHKFSVRRNAPPNQPSP